MDSAKANCYIGEVGITKKYLKHFKCLPYIAIVWSDFYESYLATSKMLSILCCLDLFLGLRKGDLQFNNGDFHKRSTIQECQFGNFVLAVA